MKNVSSDFFNTNQQDLDGNFADENIRSRDFILDAGKKLMNILGYDLSAASLDEKTKQAGKAIYDYATTLKALVKQEMLKEMQDRIKNIDTFYN